MTTKQLSTPTVLQRLPAYKQRFEAANTYNLEWQQEALFARQQLQGNDYLMDIAESDQNGLRNAILNVAAIGISLNPALKHAYLVPRDKKVMLDVSYKGMVALATATGAIEWAKAELVYEGDEFVWNGPTELPTHKADVFNEDRINPKDPLSSIKGGYCLAKLPDGTYMVDTMTRWEIITIKNAAAAKKGPWSTFPLEMAKKTIIKRASKSWPQMGDRNRFDELVELDNTNDPIDIEAIQSEDEADSPFITSEQAEEIKKRVTALGADVQKMLIFVGADDVAEILKDHYPKLMELIEAKEAKNAAEAAEEAEEGLEEVAQ